MIRDKEKLIADLLNSAIEDAIGFWMMEVTRSRSMAPETIRNYRNYLCDLIDRQILTLKNESDQLYLTQQIADLYPTICKRLEAAKNLNVNEKKYRLNALMAFTQFLESVTNGKITRIVAPLSFGLGSADRRPAPLVLNSREINASEIIWSFTW